MRTYLIQSCETKRVTRRNRMHGSDSCKTYVAHQKPFMHRRGGTHDIHPDARGQFRHNTVIIPSAITLRHRDRQILDTLCDDSGGDNTY